MASFRLLPSVGKINAYVNSIMYSKASLDMIYGDLMEIEQYSPIQSSNKSGLKDWVFQRGIFVENVSYHYPDTDVLVLNNVNLEIPKGDVYKRQDIFHLEPIRIFSDIRNRRMAGCRNILSALAIIKEIGIH